MKKVVKKAIINLNDRLEIAKKAVEATNKTAKNEGREECPLVRSVYETVISESLVMIKIPSENAPYLKTVPQNSMFAVADEKVSSLKTVVVPRHYRHGDFVERRADGSLRPTAVRHFYVSESSLGKTIPAIVEIKKKVDLVSKEETILIDIFEFKVEENLEVKNVLRLGTPATGAPGEILIPGQKNRCIKIEEARPVLISC